jgi:hypothetical protein
MSLFPWTSKDLEDAWLCSVEGLGIAANIVQ